MDWRRRADELKKEGYAGDKIHEMLKPEYPFLTRRMVREHFSGIEYVDKKEYTEQDVDDYIAAIHDLQKKQDKLSTKQVSVTLKLLDNKPIGIAFWGDWHDGGLGTDYAALEEDTQKIINADGLYWIGTGDYKDNYLTGGHAGAQYEQIVQPGMQDKIVERRMTRTADNNIALVRGCHDDWDKKMGDKDFIEHLCSITGAVNLWHGGDLYVELGTQKYHIKVRHKFPYESGLNVENSMRRMFDMQGEFDIAVSAHLHFPYFMKRPLGRKERILAKSGSYKRMDEHGQKLAGYKGNRGIPTVILYPNERHMTVSDIDDAIVTLKALRDATQTA